MIIWSYDQIKNTCSPISVIQVRVPKLLFYQKLRKNKCTLNHGSENITILWGGQVFHPK